MQSIQARMLNGNSQLLEPVMLHDLAASLNGHLLMPSDPDYDISRKVWNGMIDRRPAVIIKCLDSSDVATSVKFARRYNLLTSVKCGGHNFGGLSVCDDGIMIDLSNMRTINIDRLNKTATAEGGALLSDLDKETLALGLATTSGTVSHTGIAGLTLGGGQGWMMNKYGLTCDNLISVDIVTAEGELITASNEKNTDLFWAIRGGGGNFGIITSFKYQLHKIGPDILGGMIIYPINDAKKVLQFFRNYSMDTPDELTVMSGLLCLPDGTPVIAVAIGWMGDIEQGKQVIQPLREFGSPIADIIGQIPYLQLQSIFDAAVPIGMPRYGKMGYLPQINDEIIDIVIENFNNRTSPNTLVLFNTMKGAVARIGSGETAFFHRKPQWHFDIVAQWMDSGNELKHIKWARLFWEQSVPFTNGASINFLGTDDGQDRVKLSFGTNYERLREIKTKYDPDNFFRMNANILPMEKVRTTESAAL